jgi:hypothetical protein
MFIVILGGGGEFLNNERIRIYNYVYSLIPFLW